MSPVILEKPQVVTSTPHAIRREECPPCSTFDVPAVFRAAGLLTAVHHGDAERWSAVLRADADPAGDASAYKTLCAMAALTDRALEGICRLTGASREDVLSSFTAEFVRLLHDLQNRGDGPAGDQPGGNNQP